jgi:protein-S-isoprenylcysteine O-methyltransferase Ste14
MDSKFTDLDDEYLQNQIDKYRKKKIVLYIIFLLTAFCGVIMFAFGVKSAADNSTNPQFYLIAIGGLVTLASLILLVVSINLGRKQKIAQMTKNKRD